MTSKEALEEIIEYIKHERNDEHISFFIKLYIDDIKKDLDRLEKLDVILKKLLKYWGSISHTYNDKGDYYLLQVSYVCKYREELESIIQLFKSEKSININLK